MSMTGGRRRLETWKEISDYLNRSVRTVQRWERLRGLPVHRLSNGINERVFAYADEIDAWFVGRSEQFEKTDQLAATHLYTIDSAISHQKTNFLFRFRAIFFGIALVVFLFLGLLSLNRPYSLPQSAKIYYEVSIHENRTRIDFLNESDDHLFSITSDFKRFRQIHDRRVNMGAEIIQIADLNADGLEDIVMINPDGLEKLEFHFQRENDQFFRQTWDLRLEREYAGEQYSGFEIADIKIGDLNGDQILELLICQRHVYFEPACFRIFDLDQQNILTVHHSGALNGAWILDRNNDGNPEVYIAGTRDEDHNYSSPAFFVVEADWNQKEWELDLWGTHKILPAEVTDHMTVYYVYLKKDFLNPEVNRWDVAALLPSASGNSEELINVFASPYHDPRLYKKDIYFFQNYLRHFVFDRQLKCSYARFRPDKPELQDLDGPEVDYLLTPWYWNGTGWQEEVCEIPRSDK